MSGVDIPSSVVTFNNCDYIDLIVCFFKYMISRDLDMCDVYIVRRGGEHF